MTFSLIGPGAETKLGFNWTVSLVSGICILKKRLFKQTPTPVSGATFVGFAAVPYQ